MTCAHGYAGFCHDEATPAERERFELAHRLAFAWATSAGVTWARAEEFAGDYAAAEYGDDVDVWPAFPRAFEAWAKARGEWYISARKKVA